MVSDKIIVRGARVHNLKNINVDIPRDKLIVITGLSGSGKSSLAFDTIYAEGQRRYVESLSSYARQFLGQMDKPDVDYIEGLSPAISIDQKGTSKNPRSTVGTVTEIYDYLRLLFARIGEAHCPKCGKKISSQTVSQMVDQILTLSPKTKIQVLAPVVRGRKGEYKKLLEDIKKEGYVRLRVDEKLREVTEEIVLDKNVKHNIEVVVDRLVIKEGIEQRLADSLENALKLANGLVIISVENENEFILSENFACEDCGISLPEINPRLFSFNSPYGACPDCTGLGFKLEIDPQAVLDEELPLKGGAIRPWNRGNGAYALSSYYNALLEALIEAYGIDPDKPVKELSKEEKDLILYGSGKREFDFTYINRFGQRRVFRRSFEGIIPYLERLYRESESPAVKEDIQSRYMTTRICPSCRGARLKPEVLFITVGGKNIHEVGEMSVAEALLFFYDLNLSERQQLIAKQVLKEITNRLLFLKNVGLEYLTLNRASASLSGGEAQRIRLATQIGSRLMGVLYILDEPSIGLHQRDNQKLLQTLQELKDLGNTVIVVEHDEDTMLSADYIIDMGPGAGARGGYVVAQGTVDDIVKNSLSVTGAYLSGKKRITLPTKRLSGNGHCLTIIGAREHNLKNIDVTFPLGTFICVTGVSGSGKSTLIDEILYRALAQKLNRARTQPGKYKEIKGSEYLDKVINIDQAPIGRTPRSNPATYTGVFDYIRELFAQTPQARLRGYKPGRFSFNVKGGRCEACKGDGIIKIEMHFLPDVYVPCEVCNGARYNRETLEIKYKGKNIAEVLAMTVEEALDFFAPIPRIKNKLQTLKDVGLGYITLAQPATTLSGGEAQRIKLATELSRKATGRTLYILDEPTTGLHLADIAYLLNVLQRLVEAGNTVVVIEHNLEVIKSADYIIDLGPEGGERGGEVIAAGTPEEVAQNPDSYTGQYLKSVLERDLNGHLRENSSSA